MAKNGQKLPKIQIQILPSYQHFQQLFFMTQAIISTQSALNRYPNPIKQIVFLPIAKYFAQPFLKIYKMLKLDKYQAYPLTQNLAT